MTKIMRPEDFRTSPSADDFKAVMRGMAGAVSILTVRDGERINGMTVTSASSFAVDPPTMIVCVNRNASSYPALVRSQAFAINVVAADQRHIAEQFSSVKGIDGAARFSNAAWLDGLTGVPLLVGAAGVIECKVEEIIERHSHAIVLGAVKAVQGPSGLGNIAYRYGEYVPLTSLAEAAALFQVPFC